MLNVGLCRLIEDKRLEIEAKTEDSREQKLRQLDQIIDDPTTSPGIRLKAIDLQGRMCVWHSNTLTLETPERQRELDAARQEEVHRLLNAEFGITPMLPAQDVTVLGSLKETFPSFSLLHRSLFP